jgi:hypothetical protein
MLIALTSPNVGAYGVEKVYGFDSRQDYQPLFLPQTHSLICKEIHENCPYSATFRIKFATGEKVDWARVRAFRGKFSQGQTRMRIREFRQAIIRRSHAEDMAKVG